MCLAILDATAARHMRQVSADPSEKSKVDAVAQRQLSESAESSSTSSHVFHYIASAGLAVLAGAATAVAVYFGWPILLAAALGLGVFAVLELLNGIEGSCQANQAGSEEVNQEASSAPVDPVAFTGELLNKGLKDEDQFSGEELSQIGRNREGYLTPFKDFFDKFPYRISGIKPQEGIPYSETVFNTYVKRVLGLEEGQDALERMQECLVEGHRLRNKALQLHAFFKLIGNKNIALSPKDFEVSSAMAEKGAMFDIYPAKYGRVVPFLSQFGEFVTCQVKGEQLRLKSIADLGQDDKAPLATFNTQRSITICPPDELGNVSYIVNRGFSKASQ
jgi:hypothetical protein